MKAFAFAVFVVQIFGSLATYFGNLNCPENRDAIVHLFEWKWSDVAKECERFLGPKGYCGIQLSPVTEHRIINEPFRPWYQRYQTVSYKLTGRSGDEAGLRDMITRCNNAGVRVLVETIPNHMTGTGSGTGSAGSAWNYDNYDYTGVPYNQDHFNRQGQECKSASGNIEDFQDPDQVRNCQLYGIRDLKQSDEYVRGKILDFMNKLIDMGVAGFRVDAAKHMWPADLEVIYDRMNNLSTKWFPAGTKAYIYQEVIDQGGEAVTASQYTHLGRVTEFKYGISLAKVFRKMEGQKLKYLKNFGEEWGFINSNNAMVFVDNHDNQRGHGGGGPVVTHKEPGLYKKAQAFKLAWTYGHARMMSSFSFSVHWQGPPSDSNGNINDVPILNNGSCGGGWVCEHRWQAISNMIGFHNLVMGQPVTNWWDNGNDAIAFGRGDKGFLVINNEDNQIDQTLQTGLSSGIYCDVISGSLEAGRCTGRTVSVDGAGSATFSIAPGSDTYDSVIAIHVNAKL